MKTPFDGMLANVVKSVLNVPETDTETRTKFAQAIYLWLVERARKKPVPDLAERLKWMKGEIEKLAQVLTIEFLDGRLVVKASGSAGNTLRELQRGTDWFDPHENLASEIVAFLPDPKKYEEH